MPAQSRAAGIDHRRSIRVDADRDHDMIADRFAKRFDLVPIDQSQKIAAPACAAKLRAIGACFEDRFKEIVDGIVCDAFCQTAFDRPGFREHFAQSGEDRRRRPFEQSGAFLNEIVERAEILIDARRFRRFDLIFDDRRGPPCNARVHEHQTLRQ